MRSSPIAAISVLQNKTLQSNSFTIPIKSPASSGESPVLTINGLNADYGTTHVFVNEVSNDAVPLTILFSPNASTNVVESDVFSNLNRRDYANRDANGDGAEDSSWSHWDTDDFAGWLETVAERDARAAKIAELNAIKF